MILPLEKQVCGLESAKRLKELGCPQDSLFYWNVHKYIDQPNYKDCVVLGDALIKETYLSDYWEHYAAFTASEIGELLPAVVYFDGEQHVLGVRRYEGLYRTFYYYYSHDDICYLRMLDDLTDTTDKSLTKCMARMLIYLLENNLIESKGRNGEKV